MLRCHGGGRNGRLLRCWRGPPAGDAAARPLAAAALASAASAAACTSAARSRCSSRRASWAAPPPRRCACCSGCVASRAALQMRWALLALNAHCVHRGMVMCGGQLMLSNKYPRAAASCCAGVTPARMALGRSSRDQGAAKERRARVATPSVDLHWAASIRDSALSTLAAAASMPDVATCSSLPSRFTMSRVRCTSAGTIERSVDCACSCANLHVLWVHSNRKWYESPFSALQALQHVGCAKDPSGLRYRWAADP